MTLDNVIINKNISAEFGGGLMADNSLIPVGPNCGSHIANSTIADNRSRFAGGGISNTSCRLTIQNTTISGNQSNEGGGIMNFFGSLVVENSTISFNRAKLFGGGGIWNQDNATFTNATISSNSAKIGGGVFNSLRVLTINRTLISGNKAVSAAEAYNWAQNGATVSANNYNLFGVNNSAGLVGFSPGASDIIPPGAIGTILAPLANNGGPTLTHALVPGSPAIDAAPVNADCPSEDQRGVARPQGAACDIGAFEK
jgi:hypothetical protein